MHKNNYPADPSGLLLHAVFRENSGSPPNCEQLSIEEFGLSAREALSPDVLVKLIATETYGSKNTQVYLCYNWKQQTPFVVVEIRHDHVTYSYTPQYGHEDNYPASKWSDISFHFYTPSELNERRPDIAAVLREL